MASGSSKDYLKEYLVKIGWDFDEKKLNLAEAKSDSLLGKVVQFGKQLYKTEGLWKAATNVALAGLKEITESTISLIDATAVQSEQVDKMAKRYWTTANNWRAFSTALDTLGIEYEDLFFTTEEELNKFRELYAFSKSLEVPKGVEDTLVKVREIRQEFNNLKVLGQYFLRALTYYIGEYAKDDLIYWRNTIRDIVNLLTKKMPDAARVLGRALSIVLKTVSAIGKVFVNVIGPILRKVEEIPNSIKLIGTMLTLVLLGPLGKIIAAISMIMLLIEDYMYWKAGKHSAFDWSGIDTAFGNLKETFVGIKDDLSVIKDKFDGIFNRLKENVPITALDILQAALEGIAWLIDQISKGIDNIVNFGQFVTGKKSFNEFLEDFMGNVYDNTEGGLVDKIIDKVTEVAGFERKDKDIPHYSMAELRAMSDAGVVKTTDQGRTVRSNSVTIDSHDTFNVNSVEEANSLVGLATDRIIKSLNSGLSPALR